MSYTFLNLYDPGQSKGKLPTIGGDFNLNAPNDYIPSKGLSAAVNVALALGQPLFLTGEPGSGKTQLAFHLANYFQLGDPFIYIAKTNSTAKELFYQYDHLRHFHDANYSKLGGDLSRADVQNRYITFNALGAAIMRAGHQQRSVVLIDEIDKAPRDFPNDILYELENMSFTVMETGQRYTASPELKPIVVITSNSERNMPDAFLRRCVYYHISFPSLEQLRRIVQIRIPSLSENYQEEKLDWLLGHFQKIREICRFKQPATAELLSWIELLERTNFDPNPKSANKDRIKGKDRDLLLASYSVLAKNVDDLRELEANLFNS